MNSNLKIGDVVLAMCDDWEWDNPMTVAEESHNCSCCNCVNVITCRGKSGALYQEVQEAFGKII
jgi:hypothetical protein